MEAMVIGSGFGALGILLTVAWVIGVVTTAIQRSDGFASKAPGLVFPICIVLCLAIAAGLFLL